MTMYQDLPEQLKDAITQIQSEIRPNVRSGYHLVGIQPDGAGTSKAEFTSRVSEGLTRLGIPESSWYIGTHVSRGITFYYGAVANEFGDVILNDMIQSRMDFLRKKFLADAPVGPEGWTFISLWRNEDVPAEFATHEGILKYFQEVSSIPPSAVRFDPTIDNKGRPSEAVYVLDEYKAQAEKFIDTGIRAFVEQEMDYERARILATEATDQFAQFDKQNRDTFSDQKMGKDVFMAPPSKYTH